MKYGIARKYCTRGDVLEVGAGKAAFVSWLGSRYTGLEFND